MIKILFLLFFSFNSFLLANESFDNFIDKQIKIESQLLDQNLTLEEKIDIKIAQEKAYKKLFLEYTTHKETYLNEANPYQDQMRKLKLRLNSNIYKGHTNAAMLDEVQLQLYTLRKGIRDAFYNVIQQTESTSKEFFKENINETILKYFSKYTPLDTTKYHLLDQDQGSSIVKSLHTALQELDYLEHVSHTFSAELIENSSYIYSSSRLSDSKFFTHLKNINTSYYGKKINAYLNPLHLDIARTLFVFIVIIIILISNLLLKFIMNHILKHYDLKKEDKAYIHSHITRIFKYITALLIIHIILVSYLKFDSSSINMNKLFSVAYVILFTILLYRVTNTIAYFRIQDLKSHKILKNEVINFSIKVSNVLIILIAIIAILKIMGVNLTALLSGLGIAGAAVAFAAKDSIANVFGSISILLGDVFGQGDWIETKDVNGIVVEIGLRATTIRTYDNALISIPNSELANNSVKNWTKRSIGRRIKMKVGVSYESDYDDIRQALIDIKTMLKEHPGIANENTEYQSSHRHSSLVSVEDLKGVKRTTYVHVDELYDSGINILVYCFTRSVEVREWRQINEDVIFKLLDILEKNNLKLAYPSLTLYNKE